MLTTAALRRERKNNGVHFEVRYRLLQTTAATAELGFFFVAYNTQTVRPPTKLTYERHILGMSTSHINNSRLSVLACEMNGQGSSPVYVIWFFVTFYFQLNYSFFSFFHGSVRVSRVRV